MECLRKKFGPGVLLGGRYRTVSPLNHGSFGMVFMAKDLETDQTVAIKCLTKKPVSSEGSLELAVDTESEELALHHHLGSHGHIVNLLHHFETDAHTYLVMEYCSQGDLYEAIRNGHGPLQTDHVRQFMLQLVDAVSYIHSQGVYHRDIKPENIFLIHDGTLKLGDFGLATKDKWSFETTVGSDRYMAPEQFDSAGAGYSPAQADIWAIGICLLNILFSRNPFTTPTEEDPLFLDFSRDKQSLFDVFPDMSQDTYEVIVQCMNLDPRRRSLEGAREALLRVVSFTTEDESLDDFCVAERATIVSANREPLRTPSIQSPHIDTQNGAFPWAKALEVTSQQQIRQLSAIPDNESYTEDLFSKSGETVDWCSASIQTPSLSPVLGFQLDNSMKALHLTSKPRRQFVSPAAGSLPIAMAKPLALSLSTVMGRQHEAVSKSWSDMWDEDEELEQQEKRQTLHKLNARTWSHESKSDLKTSYPLDHNVASQVVIKGNVDDDLVADGFFFQDSPTAMPVSIPTPRYSPPSKRFNFDKWAALGERRRGQNCAVDNERFSGSKSKRQVGLGHKSHEAGIGDHTTFSTTTKNWARDRQKDFCRSKGRDWNWRRDHKHPGLGDVEWVGGWS